MTPSLNSEPDGISVIRRPISTPPLELTLWVSWLPDFTTEILRSLCFDPKESCRENWGHFWLETDQLDACLRPQGDAMQVAYDYTTLKPSRTVPFHLWEFSIQDMN